MLCLCTPAPRLGRGKAYDAGSASVNWRATTKAALEPLLLRSGLVVNSARQKDRSVAVLAFHNIVPDREPPAGDRSLHLPVSEFAALIDTLSRYAAFVSLEEAVAASSRTNALRLAITFDDAYAGATSLGLDALAARGIPATIFVAPTLLGAANTWWDAAANPTDGAVLAELRNEWLDGWRAGRTAAIREGFLSAQDGSQKPLSPEFRIADEDSLRVAANRPGVTLGSHTWSHPNVAALASSAETLDELTNELRRPLEWLRAFGAPMVPMLAYPYGRWNAVAARMAADIGYTAAFRVDGGAWGQSRPPMHELPRINVPAAMRAGGVLMRMAGWVKT